MATTAPTTAIGYTQAPQYSQLAYDDELTPELQWPQSITVYDQMRKTDSQVASVLRAVTLPVRRTPWRIDPNGARPEVVELVADDLGLPIVGQAPRTPPRQKDRFSWSEHLRLALLMLPMGASYFEQVYRIEDDASRAHLRKLEWRPMKTIDDIQVAQDGGLVSIKQCWTQTNTSPKPIPVSRLVAYVHEREGGNWLGSSILRSAYKNWLLKDRLLRVQAQTIERNGMGIPVYEAAETEASLTAGLNMAKSLRAGEAAGAATPYGAKLRLMGVEGTLPDADPAIKYHDESIARAVLAHFLNLGTQTGSWALGTTFVDFFTMSLQTLAYQIADVANKHIIEDLVDVNFGESEPAPRLVFDEIGSRQQATAQAIKLLVDAGLITPDQVLDETLRQQYGLPPADPATATAPPAQGEPSRAPEPEPVPGEGSVAASAGDPEVVAEQAPEPVVAHGTHNQKDHGRRLPKSLDGDSPFAGFTRPQLQKAARRRGIELEPREDRASIERKLAAHLAGGDSKPDAVEVAPTASPARMTQAQYTSLLADEFVRLSMLRGTSEQDAREQAGPDPSIDDLKERNTVLRAKLRQKGVDYRTEEQKRTDDAEKNKLLDEVERLANEAGHDGAAKRAGASKMSRRELAAFVADANEFQRRRKAKQDAEGKGSSAVAAFKAAEDKSRASKRQVGYIKGLLRERGLSGAPAGPGGGPTSTEEIQKLSNAEARAYINRLLRGDY